MDDQIITRQIVTCTKCPISTLQTPPVPFIGELDAPILVMAQNPGIIRPQDFPGLQIAEQMREAYAKGDYTAVAALYGTDFERSYACRTALASLFGEHWLESNLFLYTNALHCRTEFNRPPTPIELSNCAPHTKSILQAWAQSNRAAFVVLIGRIAAARVLRPPFPEPGEPARLNGDIQAIYFPHYSSRKGGLDRMQVYARKFRQLAKEYGLSWRGW